METSNRERLPPEIECREFYLAERFVSPWRSRLNRYRSQLCALPLAIARPAREFRCQFQDRRATSLDSSRALTFRAFAATSRSLRARRCRRPHQRGCLASYFQLELVSFSDEARVSTNRGEVFEFVLRNLARAIVILLAISKRPRAAIVCDSA